MRSLRFLPVVFVVGVHGFVLFVPYALALVAAAHLIRRWRQPAALAGA
jgi:hypothetical protein